MKHPTVSSWLNTSYAGALILLVAMMGCTSVDKNVAPVVNPTGLAANVERELKRELGAWYPRTVDEDHGGFYSQFDEDWNRLPSQGRFVVFQSRLTWTAAEVARRRPNMAITYLPYATHGLAFLIEKQWDNTNGGFFWEIAEPGSERSPLYQEKHAYGISFGIYAAANVYRVNSDPRALKLAVDAFRWLDQHAHDNVYGGYFEALAPDGTPVVKAPGNAGEDTSRDRIGTLYGHKSMNTHIHLLESFTALYRVWPDRILRQRVQELYFLIRDRFPAHPAHLTLYYTIDWKPVPGNVSYGHDVEAAYLLVETAEVMGIKNDQSSWDLAQRMWDNVFKYGLDEINGGFFLEGPPGKTATERKKVWWVQAEAVNSALMMHNWLGSRDPRYLRAFELGGQFVVDHQIDREHGGWYDEVSEDGTKVLKSEKSNDWKDPYHTVRAILNIGDMLRREAGK